MPTYAPTIFTDLPFEPISPQCSVYVATPVPLCEIPFPSAIALTVAELARENVQGLEHDGDEVVGKPLIA